jgi:hypothetical protein
MSDPEAVAPVLLAMLAMEALDLPLPERLPEADHQLCSARINDDSASNGSNGSNASCAVIVTEVIA